MTIDAEIAIIGAGFAGAATAYFLHQAGLTDCVVLEAEDLPGSRASGLNAAMGRQIITDPEFRELAMQGMQFLRTPPAAFAEASLIDDRGSLLLFAKSDRAKAVHLASDSQRDGLTVETWDAARIHALIPFLRNVDTALFTPSDGLIDINTLISSFLRPIRHAQRLFTNAHVQGLHYANGRWTITTTAGDFRARAVVNAAGAWADTIAALAGAEPIPFQVRRRHLFVSAPTSLVDVAWPFTWDVSHNYYFRPESGGVMMSACDEDTVSADEAYCTAPEIDSLLLDKLTQYCPELATLPIAHHWAGARTFGPGDHILIKWDARAPQFFWVAGLGGHGATSAAGIGQRAAQQILATFSPR